jgi:glycosyltransferase involved in cell wall biosynthesis
MIAAARFGRTLLWRSRNGLRFVRTICDRCRELGWRESMIRAARRVASGRVFPERAPDELLPGETTPPAGAVLDVIYAIGFWPGPPKRYRVFNMAEALRAAGYAVHVMPFGRLDDVRRYRWRASALVLFRAEYDRHAGVEGVLAYARAIGMRIVYDIDDLVFDPGLADKIDAVRRMNWGDRHSFVESMARRRRLLLAADLVTVSTAYLARTVETLGRPSAVIPNSINGEQHRVAAEIAAAGPRPHDRVRIAYLSGSATHQKDFDECESALLAVMAQHPQVSFRLVGYLDLGPHWERYRARVERIGFLPAADMLRCLGEIDINLAPLELGNPFCEGKSELKFFEAALVGVPTVASATETFAAAIEDGVSGFVVRDAVEWQYALEALVTSESRRNAMGQAAKELALARYRLPALTPTAIAVLGLREPLRGCWNEPAARCETRAGE